MSAPACRRARPENGEPRRLALVQTWPAPSGTMGQLALEPHGDHVHAWWRWAEDWDAAMDPDDWPHFLVCVRPVVADVVEAFRCCASLDAGSAALFDVNGQGADE